MMMSQPPLTASMLRVLLLAPLLLQYSPGALALGRGPAGVLRGSAPPPPPPSAADAGLVHTALGPIRGAVGNRHRMWKGVPFGEPPVGALRLMPPVMRRPWGPEPLEALEAAQNCAQSGFEGYNPPGPDNTDGSLEDCLYLNIWAPLAPVSPAVRYPVLLFLTGADFDSEGASNGALDGAGIVAAGDAVVVVANSRLGVLGFLGSEQLRAASPDNSTGNLGLQDQRLAMAWIQANIDAFHGDKGARGRVGGVDVKVTIIPPCIFCIGNH